MNLFAVVTFLGLLDAVAQCNSDSCVQQLEGLDDTSLVQTKSVLKPGREAAGPSRSEDLLRTALQKVVTKFASALAEETNKNAGTQNSASQQTAQKAQAAPMMENQQHVAPPQSAPLKVTLELGGNKKVVDLGNVDSTSNIELKLQPREAPTIPAVSSQRANRPQQLQQAPVQLTSKDSVKQTEEQKAWNMFKEYDQDRHAEKTQQSGGKEEKKPAWQNLVEGLVNEGAEWREFITKEASKEHDKEIEQHKQAAQNAAQAQAQGGLMAYPSQGSVRSQMGMPTQMYSLGSSEAQEMPLSYNAAAGLSGLSAEEKAYWASEQAKQVEAKAVLAHELNEVGHAVQSHHLAQERMLAAATQEASKAYLQTKQIADAATQNAWRLSALAGDSI